MTYVLDNLTVKQGSEVQLNGISLTLPSAGVVTVIGRTLAGKTTLLKVLAGLIAPSSGTLMSDGKNLLKIPAWRRRVSMVYQQFVNYPHLSVRDNITFPLKRAGLGSAAIAEKLTYVTDLLGLGPFLDRRPSELSGGQQQRVALARSLVKDTEFLLLDEPLVNLDYKLREQLRDEFRRIFHASENRLVVYATTEPMEAMIMQGHVVVMHEGRVVQADDYREVYRRPANTMAATIFSDPPMNLFDGRIDGTQIWIGRETALALPAHFEGLSPANYIIGVRASEITLGGDVSAQVALAEINGSTTVLHLDLPFGSLVLELDGVVPHTIGEEVRIKLPTQRFFAFDAKTRNLVAAPSGD